MNRLATGLASLEDWGAITDATFIELRQPGEARYLADQLDQYVPAVNDPKRSWQVKSFFLENFALFISCMGIFGMASQKAPQRIKEVGIRKMMGASATHVVLLVNRSFLVILGLATRIATPL